MLAYAHVLNDARQLPPGDQLRLLEALASSVRQTLTEHPPRSILELRGKGKELWAEIDAQEYVDRERDSWNG